MAMADWEKSHSPLVYWMDTMKSTENSQCGRLYRVRGSQCTELLFHFSKTTVVGLYSYPLELSLMQGFPLNMSYGLPLRDAVKVCMERFSMDIAKLEIQIAEPDVMEIKKDVRVNFTGQIGAIGNFGFAIPTPRNRTPRRFCYRRDARSIYRHEYY